METAKKILIVEDTEMDAKIVVRHLMQSGIGLGHIRARSVAEAEKLLAEQSDIEFVLLDLELPDSSGTATVSAIVEAAPGVPIIVLTGHDDDDLGFEAISIGAQDYLLKDEVSPRTLSRACRYAKERGRLLDDIRKLAIRDPLIGIFNRRHFFERGEAILQAARRYGHPISALMIDCDHFKRINDTHGHKAGDEVLIHLGNTVTQLARETDLVARYGGEELMVLLQETPLEGAIEFAERVRSSVAENPVRTSAATIEFTVSIGVSTLEAETASLEQLCIVADGFLYAAKTAGRNRVEHKRPVPTGTDAVSNKITIAQ